MIPRPRPIVEKRRMSACGLCGRNRPIYSHDLCKACWKEILNDA